MACAVFNTPIMTIFSKLPDPRRPRNQLYSLQEIICTAIMATICRCDDYHEISEWTEDSLDWLQSLGLCLKGAPSHDTYERFFHHLDAAHFQKCFFEWTQVLKGYCGAQIAIDGKTARSSGGKDTSPLHLVSAFATENSLVLGQIKTKGKGCELEGIRQLLEILDLKGAVVTIDAGGCHKVVCQTIVDKKGDYLLCLKGNQGSLHAEVKNFFDQVLEVEPHEANCQYWSTNERARGGLEKREVWTSGNIDWLPQRTQWAGLQSIVSVRRTVTRGGKTRSETRYFISSMKAEAQHQGEVIRGHWKIENSLHWQLDVTFREDLSRIRKGNGAENASVLRRCTTNMLREDKESTASLKRRRLKACLKRDYLLKIVAMCKENSSCV